MMLIYLSLKKIHWCQEQDLELLQNILGNSISQWVGIFSMVLSIKPGNYQKIRFYVLKILSDLFRDLKCFASSFIH